MMPRSVLTTGIAALLAAPLLLSQQAVEAAKPGGKLGGKPGESDTGARLARLETRLRSNDERVQWQGIHGGVQMGAGAVPLLTRLLQEPPRQGHPWCAPVAARALVRLGPRAVECLPATIKVLKDGNMAQKKLALDVLGAVGPHDPDETEAYMTTVYNELRMRRAGKRAPRLQSSLVVDCMVRLSEDPKAGVDDLIAHLEGQSAGHREMALDWLALRGSEARRAIPALRELLAAAKQPHRTSFRFHGPGWTWTGSHTSQDQHRIRGKAALLLMQLGAGKLIPAAAHVDLARHEDPAIRHRSVLELGSFGEKLGAKGIQALMRAVSDRDKLVAWDAITALGMVGPAAKAAVPRLEALARGQDKARAARAAAALRHIQKEDPVRRRKYR